MGTTYNQKKALKSNICGIAKMFDLYYILFSVLKWKYLL